MGGDSSPWGWALPSAGGTGAGAHMPDPRVPVLPDGKEVSQVRSPPPLPPSPPPKENDFANLSPRHQVPLPALVAMGPAAGGVATWRTGGGTSMGKPQCRGLGQATHRGGRPAEHRPGQCCGTRAWRRRANTVAGRSPTRGGGGEPCSGGWGVGVRMPRAQSTAVWAGSPVPAPVCLLGQPPPPAAPAPVPPTWQCCLGDVSALPHHSLTPTSSLEEGISPALGWHCATHPSRPLTASLPPRHGYGQPSPED